MKPVRVGIRAGTNFAPKNMLEVEKEKNEAIVPMKPGDQIEQFVAEKNDTPVPLEDEIIIPMPISTFDPSVLQNEISAKFRELEERLNVEKIGSEVYGRMVVWMTSQIAEAKSVYEALIAQSSKEIAKRSVDGELKPVVKFWQIRKNLEFPPKCLPNGDIALYHNYNPDETTSSEISIGSTGARVVDFGFRVEIPSGWIAEVSTEGVAGQRVIVGILSGSTHKESSLKLALRNNCPSPVTKSSGHEIARMHLRRTVPAEIEWTPRD